MPRVGLSRPLRPLDLNGNVAPLMLDNPVDLWSVWVAPKAQLGARCVQTTQTDQLEPNHLLEQLADALTTSDYFTVLGGSFDMFIDAGP